MRSSRSCCSLVVLLASVALAGCDTGTYSGEFLTATEVDCVTVTADAQVDIVDFAFEPAATTVDEGGIVMWINQGSETHTVTSGTPGGADVGAEFDSPDLAAGDSYCLEFTGGDDIGYFCTFHPTQMTGEIAVGGGDTDDGGGGGGGGGDPY